MITKDQIETLLNEANKDSDRFLVDLVIAPGNKINIEMDALSGFSIGDCVKISRFIENNLDREKEDFELNVSSPGADKPFKVPQQYKKNIGRTLQVKASDGTEAQGKLINAANDQFVIETTSREKVNGKKAEITRQLEFKINQIKEAKIILSFK